MASEVQVVLHIGQFPRELVGLHREALDNGRIDATDEYRRDEPDSERNRGQGPAAEPDVDEQDDRSSDRDEDQQVESRDLRVDIGVGSPEHLTAARVQELPLVEDVSGRLEESDGSKQHGDVRFDGSRCLLAR